MSLRAASDPGPRARARRTAKIGMSVGPVWLSNKRKPFASRPRYFPEHPLRKLTPSGKQDVLQQSQLLDG
eukprot:4243400-Pyramimonas_sp.AAC.1